MSREDSVSGRAVVPAEVPNAGGETTVRGGHGNVHPLAAVKHGAHRETEIAPLAESYLAELLVELPTASERVLRLQARRLARLELLGCFEDKHGVLRNQRRGEPFAATLLAEKITSAFIRTHAGLEAQQREAGDTRGRETLASIAAELAAGDNGGDGGDG
jgi:hypothetical protein